MKLFQLHERDVVVRVVHEREIAHMRARRGKRETEERVGTRTFWRCRGSRKAGGRSRVAHFVASRKEVQREQ